MADMFPDAEVVGTDISPTQPTWIPPNLKLYTSLLFLAIEFQLSNVQ